MSRPRKTPELTPLQQQVHRILEGQSPDYLIAPFASAFVIEGLDPVDVERTLVELGELGLAEYLEMQGDVVDELTGAPVYVTELQVLEVDVPDFEAELAAAAAEGRRVLEDADGNPAPVATRREKRVVPVPVLDEAGDPVPLVIDLDNGWKLT